MLERLRNNKKDLVETRGKRNLFLIVYSSKIVAMGIFYAKRFYRIYINELNFYYVFIK
jgi:hypothetical protein